MNNKELLKKLEKESPFKLAWSILWRQWVLVLGFYIVAMFIGMFVAIIAY